MSTRTPSNDERRAEWWKLISLIRARDAYPHFLANKAEVEAWLRAGHTMRRVWEAYRRASPPFPATYETFRTYCVKHGLSKLRNGPILAPPDVGRTEAAPASTAAPPSTKARPPPNGLATFGGQAAGVHPSHRGRLMIGSWLTYAQAARYTLRALCEEIDTRV